MLFPVYNYFTYQQVFSSSCVSSAEGHREVQELGARCFLTAGEQLLGQCHLKTRWKDPANLIQSCPEKAAICYTVQNLQICPAYSWEVNVLAKNQNCWETDVISKNTQGDNWHSSFHPDSFMPRRKFKHPRSSAIPIWAHNRGLTKESTTGKNYTAVFFPFYMKK